MTTPLADIKDFTAELAANSVDVDATRAEKTLDQAAGIACEYCEQDLTVLDPIPHTVTRAVLDIATAIYCSAGRDNAVTQEEDQGIGSTAFGTYTYAEILPNLDPFRVWMVA